MKLTDPRRRMLQTLQDAGGSLGRVTLVHKTGSSNAGYRMIAALEALGAVKEHYSDDGILVQITPAGRAALGISQTPIRQIPG